VSAASAVVFAYHNVGVRALAVLLDGGVDVRLVVTHDDSAIEKIWFASVAALAAVHGLPCIAPADGNSADVVARCRAAEPDFLFSFYYRQMLKPALLAVPRRGAYNLHGSLLPKYRGRAPVNWAVLHGERETGATLHVMDAKPDHGAIVDQCAVPILGDDTARVVFDKVTVAAEIVIARSLPQLIDGSAHLTPQDFSRGGYYGGRSAEDGRIPAAAGARQIHDLVRAVAPPEYPGAFFDARGQRIVIGRTRFIGVAARPVGTRSAFSMAARDGALWIEAADGGVLRVVSAWLAGLPVDAEVFTERFGSAPLGPDL